MIPDASGFLKKKLFFKAEIVYKVCIIPMYIPLTG